MTQPDPTQSPVAPSVEPQSPPPGPYPPSPYPASPQPYGYGYPAPMMVVKPPPSGWAIASLIFGILGLTVGWCLFAVPCLVAVICGHAGLRDTNGGVKSGRGMAIAGLIMGYLLIIPIGIFVATGAIGSVFQ